MANWSDPRIGASQPTTTIGRDVATDAGLRAHMLSVYNYMASAVVLTGVVALLMATSGYVRALIDFNTGHLTGLGYLVAFAPLGIVLWINFGFNRMSTSTARNLFWAYAVLIGASFSTLFYAYTGGSIAMTFFATAAAFTSLSLWGYTTKKDLSGMGSFLIMGVFGLIVAMCINLFLQSSTFDLAVSAIGVLIFAGLTAYYTQMIKSLYFEVAGTDMQGKVAIMGALQLYIAFINMFLFLLRFMGNRN